MGGNQAGRQEDDSIDELISTLILPQEVAEGEYLCEYHRVGSCPQRYENEELAVFAMNLIPFAYDLVVDEFNYATGGHADYVVHVKSEIATLESHRTGTKHTVNTKVISV